MAKYVLLSEKDGEIAAFGPMSLAKGLMFFQKRPHIKMLSRENDVEHSFRDEKEQVNYSLLLLHSTKILQEARPL